MIWLELRPKTCRLYRSQSMMRIMQKVDIGAKLRAQFLEELWNVDHVLLRRPSLLDGKSLFCGLIEQLVGGNAVNRGYAWNPGLRSDGNVPKFHKLRHRISGFLNIASVRVPINRDFISTLATKQIVNGCV